MDKLFSILKELLRKIIITDNNPNIIAYNGSISCKDNIVTNNTSITSTNNADISMMSGILNNECTVEVYSKNDVIVIEKCGLIKTKDNNIIFCDKKDKKLFSISISDIRKININGDIEKVSTNNITINVFGKVEKCTTNSGTINVNSTNLTLAEIKSNSGEINVTGNIDTASTVSGNIKASEIKNANSLSGNIKIK